MSRGLTDILRATGIGIVATLGAHALAFLLIRVLPDSAVIALGIQGAQESVFQAFQHTSPPRSYGQILLDLATGNLGKTLDGVRVAVELTNALRYTAPRLLVVLASIVLVILVTAFRRHPESPLSRGVFGLATFMPPYVFPFIGLLVATTLAPSAATTLAGGGMWWMCAVSLGIPPAALAGFQTANIMARNLAEPFAATTRAAGASPFRLRAGLKKC